MKWSNLRRSATVALAVLAGTLAGCNVGPDYHAPVIGTPGAWSATSQPISIHPTTYPATMPTEAADIQHWWSSLGDETLNSLVHRAIRQNLDLEMALERVNQARAVRGIARSDLLPTVNADGHYSRQRLSRNTPLGSALSKPEYDDWQAGFDASWELDVFGRVRRSVGVADAELTSAAEGQRDVLVRVVAETARQYVELRSAQRRMKVAADNLEAQQSTNRLVKAKRGSGAVSDLDVARSEADVKTAEAAIPQLQSQINEAIYAIGVLLGQEPTALNAELSAVSPIPSSAAPPVLGVPSELLRRRPDIRRAERDLQAATGRIGVAVADYYPRFTLTGSFSMDSSKFSRLGDADSRQFSLGPAVSWNIFDAGRIRNNVRLAEARQREALASYHQTVIQAFEEVETGLSRYVTERDRRTSIVEGVQASGLAVDLARQQYAAGAVDLLEVLDAQRRFLAAQDSLARSDAAAAIDLIAIYKGLGGGWESEEQLRAVVSKLAPAPSGK